MNILYSPNDIENGGASASNENVENPTRQPYIPYAIDGLIATGNSVVQTWEQNPKITLIFTTLPELKAKLELMQSKLIERTETGKYRPGQTNTLEVLDNAIEDGVSSVKRYLEDKYETDDATAYYPIVGIEHKGNRWFFPESREQRLTALGTMVKGIAAEGLDKRKYGKDFWVQMEQDYKAALKSATTTDKSVSKAVIELNELQADVRFTLQGLLYVLRGNYQKNYQEVYRAWGFRK